MQIDLNTIYQRAFGYIAPPFPNGNLNIDPLAGIENIMEGTDLLGRPIPMPITLNGLLLQNAVVTIAGQKTIVQTPLAGNGLRGTVKELVSVDDYKLTIHGVIVNTESDDFPEDEVLKLREQCERREALPIDSPICGLFDIDQVVVSSWRFPDIRWLHAQPYEIIAVSDDDFIAELLLDN